MNLVSLFGCLAGLATLAVGCTASKPSTQILRGFAVAADDSEVLFAALSSGKSSLYRLNITTGDVVAVISKDAGVVHSPCYAADQKRLFYVHSRQEAGKPLHTIETSTLAGDSATVLFATNQVITTLLVAPLENKLYFVAARHIGHSSPIAPARPRDLNLYSLEPGRATAKLALALPDYVPWCQLQLDQTGEHLFLCLHASDNSNPSGPYSLSLKHDSFSYLMPASLLTNQAHLTAPESGKAVRFPAFYAEFTEPVPAYSGKDYFLLGYQQILRVSSDTDKVRLLYQAAWQRGSGAQQPEHYSIQAATSLHQAPGLLVQETGSQTLRFVRLSDDGRYQTIPVSLPLPKR